MIIVRTYVEQNIYFIENHYWGDCVFVTPDKNHNHKDCAKFVMNTFHNVFYTKIQGKYYTDWCSYKMSTEKCDTLQEKHDHWQQKTDKTRSLGQPLPWKQCQSTPTLHIGGHCDWYNDCLQVVMVQLKTIILPPLSYIPRMKSTLLRIPFWRIVASSYHCPLIFVNVTVNTRNHIYWSSQ